MWQQQFSARPTEKTTTRMVATRANVNASLIAHHFGSKDDLWKAVADHIFELVKGRIRESDPEVIEKHIDLVLHLFESAATE